MIYLLITSDKSYEQHLEHLEAVFTRLRDTGLKVNLTKSKLCQTELEYLGILDHQTRCSTLNKKGGSHIGYSLNQKQRNSSEASLVWSIFIETCGQKDQNC